MKGYVIDWTPEARLEHLGKIGDMAKSNVGTVMVYVGTNSGLRKGSVEMVDK